MLEALLQDQAGGHVAEEVRAGERNAGPEKNIPERHNVKTMARKNLECNLQVVAIRPNWAVIQP